MTRNVRNTPYTTHFKLLNKVHTQLSGHEQAEFNHWLKKERIKFVIEQLRMIEIIPTIYQKEQPDKLCTYYYPSKVYRRSDKKKVFIEANLHSNFLSSNGIIIEGTVGQGKSILLRHLHISELNSGESIPIFIELKDIKKDTTLCDFICSYITNTLKLRCSPELFEELLQNGVFSFFFDGFDELPYDKRNSFVEFISYINNNNGNSKIFVTSRPGNEIQSLSTFDIFSINPLNGKEQINFVNKLLNKKHNREQINFLKSNLEEMNAELRKLLTTPLILTLFAMVYKNKIKIPDSYSVFYRTLFDTLVSEHDGLKLGFSRPTRSGLPADRIKTILEHLSLFSIQEGIKTFSSDEFIKTIKSVLATVGEKNVNANHVIEDLTKNTCLIQIDDMDYKYLHISIPNYFAASCITNDASDEEAIEFYKGARKKWNKWYEVIEFLMNIDKRRFNPNFLVPELSLLFNKSKLPNEFVLTKNSVNELSKNFVLGCVFTNQTKTEINPSSNYTLLLFYFPNSSWVFKRYFGENGYGSDKVRLQKAVSTLTMHIKKIPSKKVAACLLKENEATQHGSNSISSARLHNVLAPLDIEGIFNNEVKKLILEPIKEAYSKAVDNEKRVLINRQKKVFQA